MSLGPRDRVSRGALTGWQFLAAPLLANATPVGAARQALTAQPIPASVRVPCDGRGKVEFSPCPYLAPCVAGWSPGLIRVTFVNIAA